MRRPRQDILATPLRPCRIRGFTFIELIVAVALSIVLMRGMYVVFYSATNLTTLSESKSELLLESSAIYEYISRDIARAPYSGPRLFNTSGGSTLTFRATGLGGRSDVYIRYGHDGNNLNRSVFSVADDGSVGDPTDEDGDGAIDSGMAMSSKVTSFEVWCHSSGGIAGGWSQASSSTTRAVRVRFKLNSSLLAGSGLQPDVVDRLTTFIVCFPVMSM